MREDPENFAFVFEETTCKVCRQRERHMRLIADRDTKHAKKFKDNQPPPGEVRPTDGLHVSMRQATPEEISRVRARRNKPQGGGDD